MLQTLLALVQSADTVWKEMRSHRAALESASKSILSAPKIPEFLAFVSDSVAKSVWDAGLELAGVSIEEVTTTSAAVQPKVLAMIEQIESAQEGA